MIVAQTWPLPPPPPPPLGVESLINYAANFRASYSAARWDVSQPSPSKFGVRGLRVEGRDRLEFLVPGFGVLVEPVVPKGKHDLSKAVVMLLASEVAKELGGRFIAPLGVLGEALYFWHVTPESVLRHIVTRNAMHSIYLSQECMERLAEAVHLLRADVMGSDLTPPTKRSEWYIEPGVVHFSDDLKSTVVDIVRTYSRVRLSLLEVPTTAGWAVLAS